MKRTITSGFMPAMQLHPINYHKIPLSVDKVKDLQVSIRTHLYLVFRSFYETLIEDDQLDFSLTKKAQQNQILEFQ